jgi:hypothetical protein
MGDSVDGLYYCIYTVVQFGETKLFTWRLMACGECWQVVPLCTRKAICSAGC